MYHISELLFILLNNYECVIAKILQLKTYSYNFIVTNKLANINGQKWLHVIALNGSHTVKLIFPLGKVHVEFTHSTYVVTMDLNCLVELQLPVTYKRYVSLTVSLW